MKHLKRFEDIKIPINVGDTILGGRFKNKKTVVKKIGKNAKGDITVNGKPLLKYRLTKESAGFEEDTEELLLPVRDAGIYISAYELEGSSWTRIFMPDPDLSAGPEFASNYSFDSESFDWKKIEADVQAYLSYMTEELGYSFIMAYYIGENDGPTKGFKREQIEIEDIMEGRIPERIKHIAIEFKS